MKMNRLLFVLMAGAFMAGSFWACQPGNNGGNENDPGNTAAVEQIAYTFSVEEQTPLDTGFHSFAWGATDTNLLIVGGRMNGLHTGYGASGFATAQANDNLIVIDRSTMQITHTAKLNKITAPIDTVHLRANNSEFVQVGDTLYFVGGMEVIPDSGIVKARKYITALSVADVIGAVKAGSNIDASMIAQISADTIDVTGGEMDAMSFTESASNELYLVFGWRFGQEGSVQDPYTHTIYKTTLSYNKAAGTIALGQVAVLATDGEDESSNTGSYRRRDGNMAPVVMNVGGTDTPYLMYYGGVFMNSDSAHLKPVLVKPNGADSSFTFGQVISNYTCPIVPGYTKANKKMYSGFFGGMTRVEKISGATFPATVQPGVNVSFVPQTGGGIAFASLLPFHNMISVITLDANKNMEQWVMEAELPGSSAQHDTTYNGANAAFVMDSSVPDMGNGVIDLDALFEGAAKGTKKPVGYLIGGIESYYKDVLNNILGTDEAVASNYSGASKRIFKVYITKNE